MAHRQVEQEIERLNQLRDTEAAEAIPILRKALADRINLIVAKAAKVAAEMRLDALIPDLLRAFDRLLEKPDRDPQCWGKVAIAKALVDLNHHESAPFARGIQHIQMEAVWGGKEDTAATLRGTCALALPACNDLPRGQIFRYLVDGLGDKALPVRADTARAIAQMDGEEAVLILRLKARLGDPEVELCGQIFDHLLVLEGDSAVPFVARFLDPAGGAVAEESALALGSSRLPAAAEVLQDTWGRERDPELRAVLLRALSATRQPSAIEFLLNLVRGGRMADAITAVDALAVHRGSAEIFRHVKEAAKDREPEVRDRWRQSFAPPENA